MTAREAILAAIAAWDGWRYPWQVMPCLCERGLGEKTGPGPLDAEGWAIFEGDRYSDMLLDGHERGCADAVSRAEREFGEHCQADAEECARLGRAALDAIAMRDIVGAWECLRCAVLLERQYHGEDYADALDALDREFPVPPTEAK